MLWRHQFIVLDLSPKIHAIEIVESVVGKRYSRICR